VDNLSVTVVEVDTLEDANGVKERHSVKLIVEGEQVTVTLWDTKCKMGIQATSQLIPYTHRVLFPYLKEQIELHDKEIREKNENVRTHGETKVMTRNKRQQELFVTAAILESPVRTAAPLSVTAQDSPAPIRLLNQFLTWAATPSRASEEQEKELEKE
jgi:hypothetical protein